MLFTKLNLTVAQDQKYGALRNELADNGQLI